ncbi:hypothetical protein [Mycoplasma sp. VS410B]|uniref:restriction endonuclease subunit S n=1 Tax=Mycoplasma sp. VS410B TaxID=3401688 RepID=UPI003AAB2040
MEKEKLVPVIRFKGFDEEWKVNRLSSYLNVVVKRNEQLRYSQNEVLSVSKDSGVINQIKYLGRSYAGSDLRNYKILELSHIVYTKSPLNETPFGIIKTNNYEQGIVSTLYATYEPSSACHSNFVEHYFSKYDRLNNYLYPLVNKGAKNTLLISDETALSGYVIFPYLDEQQEISDLLDNLALLIHSQELKLEKLQTIKQSLLNKMFANNAIKSPRIQFNGFGKEWKTYYFNEIIYPSGEKNINNLPLKSYSVSNKYGFVNQEEQFKYGGIALAADKSRSTIVDCNTFAYNPARIDIGSIGYWDKDEKILISPMYEVFKTNKNFVNDIFLEKWFKTEIFNSIVLSNQEGGVRTCFGLQKMLTSCVTIPGQVFEQQKIGQFFSNLDSLIHSQELKLEKLNNIKQALLEKMFC